MSRVKAPRRDVETIGQDVAHLSVPSPCLRDDECVGVVREWNAFQMEASMLELK